MSRCIRIQRFLNILLLWEFLRLTWYIKRQPGYYHISMKNVWKKYYTTITLWSPPTKFFFVQFRFDTWTLKCFFFFAFLKHDMTKCIPHFYRQQIIESLHWRVGLHAQLRHADLSFPLVTKSKYRRFFRSVHFFLCIHNIVWNITIS